MIKVSPHRDNETAKQMCVLVIFVRVEQKETSQLMNQFIQNDISNGIINAVCTE